MERRFAEALIEAWKNKEMIPGPSTFPTFVEVITETGETTNDIILRVMKMVRTRKQHHGCSFYSRTYMGKRFSVVSDLLWEGKFESALRLLVRSKPSTRSLRDKAKRDEVSDEKFARRSEMTETGELRRFSAAGRVRLRMRKLDAGSDWKTVK